MNITINPVNVTEFEPSAMGTITQHCADWCVNQKISSNYNLELEVVLLVAIPLLLMLASEYFRETNHPRIADWCVSLSIYGLYIFFFAYFVIMRMGLYHYG